MQKKSFAKLNLFLKVTGRRPDGYHNIESLLHPIGLHDVLRFQFKPGGVQVYCDDPLVPPSVDANLAGKAALSFYTAARQKIPPNAGVQIEIIKQIPVGAGLGGGSSNAACVLSVLNEYYGHALSSQQLHTLSAGIGADVPFFLYLCPAVATGIGTDLTFCNGCLDLWALLVMPHILVSTGKVYARLNLGLTKKPQPHKNLTFIDSDLGGFTLTQVLNDLEAVTFEMHPALAVIKSDLLANGARAAAMTGSGACVFGLFDSRRTAETALVRMRNRSDRLVCITPLVGM